MAGPKKGGTLNLGGAPPPPPHKNAGPPSSSAALQSLTKLPGEQRYAQWIGLVKNAAKRWGVDPVELMATLMWEGGQATSKPNAAGAIGLGQIVDSTIREELNPEQYQSFVREVAHGHTKITPQMAADPAFGIAYMAWRMAGSRRDYQSLNAWYSSPGYNPGFAGDSRGAGPESLLVKAHVGGYQPNIPQSPTQKAGSSVDTSGAKASITDRWAVITPQGNIKFVPITDLNTPPPYVLRYAGSTPMTELTYTQAWKQSDEDTYEAYTGKKANGPAIQQILAEAPSPTQSATELANRPGFSKSPAYKRTAPGLVALGRQVLGNDWQPSGGIIREAIAQNWDQRRSCSTYTAASPATRRGRSSERTSPRTPTPSRTSTAQDPTGDPTIQQMLREKTQAGWTPDQITLWAQQQPAYKHSPAYQAKTVSFLQQLGLITGQQATLTGPQVDQMLQAAHNVAAATNAANSTFLLNPSPHAVPPPGPGGAPALISEHGLGQPEYVLHPRHPHP